MSAYGDMLAFFPELMHQYKTFTMSPKPVAGFYQPQNEIGVMGILQFIKGGDIDFEGKASAETEYPTFWTRKELVRNAYIEDDDGQLYRRTKSNQWKRYGNFNAYILEAVVGANGKQVPEEAVDLGVSTYD